jgi:sarcosine oxidase
VSSAWDVIVIGVGGMGAATCLELARRGARVLGLERFDIAHALGSSHGETRIIRKAYFEAPDYVPLVLTAYRGWHELARESERELLIESGLILVSPASGSVVPLAEAAGRAHGLAFERPSVTEARSRFPGFQLADDALVLYEPDAGFLKVEDCVQAAADVAVRHGAELRVGCVVENVSSTRHGVRVQTRDGAFEARRAIVSAGAWSPSFLGKLASQLVVRRKLQLWLGIEPGAYPLGTCPVYAFETESGFFYGFPALEPGSVKVAHHTGGEVVPDPSKLDRELHERDLAPVLAFAKQHLERANGRALRHRACMYTMTPDEHFVIDRHPDHENVIIACGFSGHGFKFAPMVAKAAADLALDDRTPLPIGLFSATRPTLA